jgi:polyphosphate:AMP phosphotransferase
MLIRGFIISYSITAAIRREYQVITGNLSSEQVPMLEKCDLTETIDDKTLEKDIPPLQEMLGVLQRTIQRRKIPVIIVIEGWNEAGIIEITREIIRSLDPRGYDLYAIKAPTAEEAAYPFMWRFWWKTPENGRIAIFARSWYSRAITEEISRAIWKKSFKGKRTSINNFERQLIDSGVVIVKFFLHISKEEQKRRLEHRERNPLTAYQVTPRIWSIHNQYDDNLPLIDDLIEKTDTDYSPWHVIPATDLGLALLKVYSAMVTALEDRIDKKNVDKKNTSKKEKSFTKEVHLPKTRMVRLESSPPVTYNKEECQEALEHLQIEMIEFHSILHKRKIPLVIVYEGRDAAGKGGSILRISRFMHPLGFNVAPVGAPTDIEKKHHFLWRFYQKYPKAGHITIFDRSWYGRVLVERVEGFCTETEWKRAYTEINEMEEEFTENGGGIIKFWLEISKEEQLKRFNQRVADPLKIWKITEEDWRNREKWDLYTRAIDDMLSYTNPENAPWTVIESDDKWYARVKTMKTLVDYGQSLF